jgi:hypothetical protein
MLIRVQVCGKYFEPSTGVDLVNLIFPLKYTD